MTRPSLLSLVLPPTGFVAPSLSSVPSLFPSAWALLSVSAVPSVWAVPSVRAVQSARMVPPVRVLPWAAGPGLGRDGGGP